jgi:polyisoprenoid-binding protein YceI
MATATQTTTRTFAIDPSHSRVGFTVRHMGFSKVRGAFETFEGTVRMNGDDLATLSTEATIQAATVSTGDEKRDGHLRSAEFFETETYPTLTFESTGVRDVQGDAFTLVGTLTMHGVSKEVALDAVYLGSGTDPWGGTRVAFEASTKVNREDFGLTWNAVLESGGLLVSKEVEITLEIQAVEQADA